MNGQVYFYRGMAAPQEEVPNPLDVRNPLLYSGDTEAYGVHFVTCGDLFAGQRNHLIDASHPVDKIDHVASAQSWAIGASKRGDGLFPSVVRFALGEDGFDLLRDRIWAQGQRQRGYKRVNGFEELKYVGEVILNGRGLSVPDFARLGLELGRLRDGRWFYEKVAPFGLMPEGQTAVYRERARA